MERRKDYQDDDDWMICDRCCLSEREGSEVRNAPRTCSSWAANRFKQQLLGQPMTTCSSEQEPLINARRRGAARDTFSGEESCGHIPTSGHEFSLVRRAQHTKKKAQQPTAPFE